MLPLATLRRVSRRLGWGVADQGVSSLTNFAVNIYIARELGAVQYGAFSLAYVTYSFALNASRGLATDPLLVRFSYTDPAIWRRAVASCTGTATVVGLASGACILATALALSGATRQAFLALGLTLPGLMLQDSWRFAFFALGRGSQAFLNDVIWLAVLIPALLVMRAEHYASVFWFFLAWGASAAVAAAVGPLQARVLPRLGDARLWVAKHRDLGVRYLAEGTTNSAAAQLRNYGIALILGLAAVGYVQAANTLMGPFMVVITGAGLILLPEATRIRRDSPQRMSRYCFFISAASVLLGALWGAALLVALPRGLGMGLLGRIWRPSYPLVLPTILSVLGLCATSGAGTGLHALGAARRSLKAAIVTSAIYVAFSIAGAVAAGTVGAVGGTAVATWLGALVYWTQFRSALRESSQPAEQPSGSARKAGKHRARDGPA